MFANISQADKEAFFSLLDEYFATRGGVAAVAAAKGPAGQQALSKIQSSATHLKSDFDKRFGGTGGHSSSTAASAEPPAASAASGHADASSSVDHTDRPSFAALRGAFSNASAAVMSGASAAGLGRSNTTASGAKVPPPVAPRNRFQAPAAPQPPPEPEEDEPPPPVIPKRTVAPPAPAARVPAGLQSGKHIGNSKIDITSGGTIVSSMWNSRKTPATSMPSPPPSSAPKSSYNFAPPPVRRAPSSTASDTPAASTPPPPAPPPPPPAPARGQEPEEEGQWVEALYEYTSDVSFHVP
ncbi:hypothetical protein FRC00_006291 [Tulasnella sp. 408]|nr:hypothetical protein FRC00_006291 [Tulasnella sp. 408]